MASREIKELRQSGKLNEALEMALNEFNVNPDGIWERRNLSWVYYDFCKLYASHGDYASFEKVYSNMLDAGIVQTEHMLGNSMVWIFRNLIVNYIKAHEGEEFSSFLDEVSNHVMLLAVEKPSKEYTIILEMFYKFRNTWSGFCKFMDNWGWENFEPRSYECEVMSNGRKMPISTVEGCYISYAKILLKSKNVEEMTAFISKLAVMSEAHPEMMYIGYYQCELMMCLGEDGTQSALDVITPIARKKIGEFWIWSRVAEIVKGDDEKYLASLLRSVNCCGEKEKMVNVYLSLVTFLVAKKDFVGARKYLSIYAKIKQESANTYVPRDVYYWMREPWYSSAEGVSLYDNVDYMQITDEMLLGELPSHTAVVVHNNKEKRMVSVIIGKGKDGFFKYQPSMGGLNPGDVLNLKLEADSIGGKLRVVSCKKNPSFENTDYVKRVSGTIEANHAGTAFFLKTEETRYFIDPILLKNQEIANREFEGVAVFCYNKKRETWDWKIVSFS